MNNSVKNTYVRVDLAYLAYEKWRNCLRVVYLIRILYIARVIRLEETRNVHVCAIAHLHTANNNRGIITTIIDFCRRGTARGQF